MEVVGVRFRDSGHIYYYAPGKAEYHYDERVIVESQQAKMLAKVAIPKIDIDKSDLPKEVLPILHKAEQGFKSPTQRSRRSGQPWGLARRKSAHGIWNEARGSGVHFGPQPDDFYLRQMAGWISGTWSRFMGNSAPGLNCGQIGVRDEAKLLGGLGPCGRPLCCATFLGDFIPCRLKWPRIKVYL